MPRLRAIWVHPIKSCAGIAVQAATVDVLGLIDDRRWQIVTAEGDMLTQREEPRLALIRPRLHGQHLVMSAPGMADVVLARQSTGQRRRVRCWSHEGESDDCGEPAAAWLENFLGRPARLVAWDPAVRRPIPPGYHPDEALTAFTDGFPLLVVSQASIDDLSLRVGRTIDARRFRANLLIDQCAAHAEDDWRRIRIGDIPVAMVKPCSRCTVTTVDPDTGMRDGDGEPLRTLAQYRRQDGKVMFAQNAVHAGPGRLRVGDAVTVLA